MEFLTKTDEQSVKEYINELISDCLQLHIFAKAETLQALDEKNQAGVMSFYLEYGDEPQYQLLRMLGFYNEINPQAQKDMLVKIYGLVDVAKIYVNKIKAQSPEDRRIRGSAEYLYLDGSSPKEIVSEMIETGVLDEYDDQKKLLFNMHLSRINSYVQNFPSFKIIEEMKQQDDWDTLDLGAIEELEKKDKQLRSILVMREDLH
jgi:hypothetical protein|tara:strand:+ start:94 stop:705 length:612 start_codon:yes stop_codon:yes gene_type:complete